MSSSLTVHCRKLLPGCVISIRVSSEAKKITQPYRRPRQQQHILLCGNDVTALYDRSHFNLKRASIQRQKSLWFTSPHGPHVLLKFTSFGQMAAREVTIKMTGRNTQIHINFFNCLCFTFRFKSAGYHTRQLSLTLLRQEGHRAIHIKH